MRTHPTSAFALMLMLTAMAGPPAVADEAAFGPLAELVGYCWRGQFADGQRSDEHCYKWVFDRQFIRDRHVVRGGAQGEYIGETIYAHDASAGRIVYWYWASAGNFSSGSAVPGDDEVIFPDEVVETPDERMVLRTVMRLLDDAYETQTMRKTSEGWELVRKVTYRRVGAAG